MYTVPQEGDRVQEIGYEPRHGVLVRVSYNDRRGVDEAAVWWDDDLRRAHVIDFDYIEMEHPQ